MWLDGDGRAVLLPGMHEQGGQELAPLGGVCARPPRNRAKSKRAPKRGQVCWRCGALEVLICVWAVWDAPTYPQKPPSIGLDQED